MWSVRTLIVDANVDDSSGLLAELRQAEYEVVRVGSIRQAHDLLARERFDVLLLDVACPDGNSLAVCDELRERLGQELVIIVVSEHSTTNERVVALELGADDILDKPFHIEELSARMAAHHRRRHIHARG